MRVLLITRSFVVHEGKVLLIKRSSTNKHNPGLWECPGGKVEEQDIWISRIREIMEETKLLAEPSSLISYVDRKIIVDGKFAGTLCLRIFSVMRLVNGEVRLSPEHESFVWTSYGEMFSYKLTTEVMRAAIVLREYLK